MERFWSKVSKKPNKQGCLLWTGAKTKIGYGVFQLNKRARNAHRIGYYLYNNKKENPKMVISHICEDFYNKDDHTYKSCINPKHLEEVNNSSNTKRAFRNGRNNMSEEARLSASNRLKNKRYNSKLTKKYVIEIKDLIKKGETHQNIANKYGVVRQTITSINIGKNWSNA